MLYLYMACGQGCLASSGDCRVMEGVRGGTGGKGGKGGYKGGIRGILDEVQCECQAD